MAHPSPAIPASLHQPIERFRGSHSGIVDGLDQLRELPALAKALSQARATATAALALFEHEVLPHHADEEKELFVSVARSAADGAESARVDELVARLVAQHRSIERLWSWLRPAVLAIAAGKPGPFHDIEGEVADLVETYLDHTRLEEEVFLPLADEILSRNPNHMAALDISLHLRHTPIPRAAYI